MPSNVMGLAVVLLAAMAGTAAAGPPAEVSTEFSSLLGTWALCGNARIDVRGTNPRGVENAKLVFRPDRTFEWRPADATGPERSEFGRVEAASTGIRLFDSGGRHAGVLAVRSRDERVLSGGGGGGVLLCRLGDVAAADRPLQPRSIAFYRSADFDDPGIARNAEARRPAAGSLLGTWELARLVVHDSAQAWFDANPYGQGHIRIAFDGRQFCFAVLQPTAYDVDRGCVPAPVRGLRVRADDDAGGMLAPWIAGEVRITADGVMRVPRPLHDEEFVWLGPDDLTAAPLEGRITLVTFPGENDPP